MLALGPCRTSGEVRLCAAIGGRAGIEYAPAAFRDGWVHDLNAIVLDIPRQRI